MFSELEARLITERPIRLSSVRARARGIIGPILPDPAGPVRHCRISSL